MFERPSLRARRWLTQGALFLGFVIGCGDSKGPVDPVNPPLTTGGPRLTTRSLEVDYAMQSGTLRLGAIDPDTIVSIQCVGAFPITGSDSVVATRPFAELRQYPFLVTWCDLTTPGDSALSFPIDTVLAVPLDDGPSVEAPLPMSQPLVDVPTLFSMSAADDWGIVEHWIYFAPGSDLSECATRWTRARTTALSTPATAVTDTITLTFAAPGPYCVGFGAKDDARIAGSAFDGNNAGSTRRIEVLTE